MLQPLGRRASSLMTAPLLLLLAVLLPAVHAVPRQLNVGVALASPAAQGEAIVYAASLPREDAAKPYAPSSPSGLPLSCARAAARCA